MFSMYQDVQIVNHVEPSCNGEYGTVVAIETAYSGTVYYTVAINGGLCDCTEDELMEG